MRTATALTLLLPVLAGVAVSQARLPPPTSVGPLVPGTRALGGHAGAVADLPAASATDTTSRAGAATTPGHPTPPTTRPSGRWGWPLAPRPGVARRFDRPEHRWSAGHRGVDLVSTVGQLVLAAGDGVVAFVGNVAGRGVVSIAHPGGWRTTYEPVAATVAVGDAVRRGDRIGTLAGVAGHCAPRSCLHWGALLGQDYRDPLALVLGRRPVLLPLS